MEDADFTAWLETLPIETLHEIIAYLESEYAEELKDFVKEK